MTYHLPKTPQQWFLVVISSIAMVWYYICIVSVGSNPPAELGVGGTQFRQFMTVSITTISVTLATFVGMLLGFQYVHSDINAGVNQVKEAAGAGVAGGLPRLQTVAQTVSPNLLQFVAGVAYVLSLVLAVYYWWSYQDRTDPAISNLAQSLLGLFGGALAVFLNTSAVDPVRGGPPGTG
jgi:hypothetical protein